MIRNNRFLLTLPLAIVVMVGLARDADQNPIVTTMGSRPRFCWISMIGSGIADLFFQNSAGALSGEPLQKRQSQYCTDRDAVHWIFSEGRRVPFHYIHASSAKTSKWARDSRSGVLTSLHLQADVADRPMLSS